MLIADLLIVLSSVSVIDTTRPPVNTKVPVIIRPGVDTIIHHEPKLPERTKKIDKKDILRKVRRGGWDGN